MNAEAFWERVRKGPGCWEWQGPRNAAGYGQLSGKDGPLRAHRVAWILTYGEIPARQNGGEFTMSICHHCDNPPCVRPDHLFLGTAADNARDRNAKGRTRTRVLSADAIIEIRALRAKGATLATLAARYSVSPTCIYNQVGPLNRPR